jgi:hypothetical protein
MLLRDCVRIRDAEAFGSGGRLLSYAEDLLGFEEKKVLD